MKKIYVKAVKIMKQNKLSTKPDRQMTKRGKSMNIKLETVS